jgi:hypothetical protein
MWNEESPESLYNIGIEMRDTSSVRLVQGIIGFFAQWQACSRTRRLNRRSCQKRWKLRGEVTINLVSEGYIIPNNSIIKLR